MVVAFRTAIEILRQLVRMNQLIAAGTLDPTAKSILFGGLDFNLRFVARKESHKLTSSIIVNADQSVNLIKEFLRGEETQRREGKE